MYLKNGNKIYTKIKFIIQVRALIKNNKIM